MTKSAVFGEKKPPAKAKSTTSKQKSNSLATPTVVVKCEENQQCDGNDGIYVIEKILAYRTITTYEYLIQWESDCPDSWILEENLSAGAKKDAKQLRTDVEKNGAYLATN